MCGAVADHISQGFLAGVFGKIHATKFTRYFWWTIGHGFLAGFLANGGFWYVFIPILYDN